MLHTFKPTASIYQIEMEDSPTEFEIQAFIYWSLKSKGVSVRGEIKVSCADAASNTTGTCRFDILIFNENRLSRIVEVKKNPFRDLAQIRIGRQCRRYRRFGVPVTYVFGMESARKFVESFDVSIDPQNIPQKHSQYLPVLSAREPGPEGEFTYVGARVQAALIPDDTPQRKVPVDGRILEKLAPIQHKLTHKHLGLLGVQLPIKKGWMKKLLGNPIGEQDLAMVLALK